GILLEFEERDSGADRVDRARRNEDEVAGRDGPPVDQLLDRPIERRRAQNVAVDFAFQTEPECRAGLGIEDVPALALAVSEAALTRLLVVRMHLDRKPFAG